MDSGRAQPGRESGGAGSSPRPAGLRPGPCKMASSGLRTPRKLCFLWLGCVHDKCVRSPTRGKSTQARTRREGRTQVCAHTHTRRCDEKASLLTNGERGNRKGGHPTRLCSLLSVYCWPPYNPHPPRVTLSSAGRPAGPGRGLLESLGTAVTPSLRPTATPRGSHRL